MVSVYLPHDGFTIIIDIVGVLGLFMSCSDISSDRTLSVGVVVGNCVGNYVGDGVAGIVVGGFVAGI